MLNRSLIEELSERGVKHTPQDIVGISKLPDGRIVFLEKGKERSGLLHIVTRHVSQFEAHGISESEIPEVVMLAITEGVEIGIQGKDRIVYAVTFRGIVHNIAVSIANNGYIVSANPKGRKR